jgi:hypothetical protein
LISSKNVSTGVLSASFPNLTHKHQSIICRLLPRLMLRYRRLLPLLQLRHHYHDDDYDDHNDSGFYVRTRTADLTSLS